MNCSIPRFPVLHCLLEFAQIHVHWVGDAIQPSHPLSPPFLLPSVSPSIRVFFSESALHIGWPKYWRFSFSISPSNEYSGFISFRIDWFLSPCCPRDSQESSPALKFESIKSLALRLLYGPTRTSIHDYWKNHSFDYPGKVISKELHKQDSCSPSPDTTKRCQRHSER